MKLSTICECGRVGTEETAVNAEGFEGYIVFYMYVTGMVKHIER